MRTSVRLRPTAFPRFSPPPPLCCKRCPIWSLRVIEKDKQPVGRETVYEIQVNNPGNAAATSGIQVEFPPGPTPKSRPGGYAIFRRPPEHRFRADPRAGPREQAVYRVTAVAQ